MVELKRRFRSTSRLAIQLILFASIYEMIVQFHYMAAYHNTIKDNSSFTTFFNYFQNKREVLPEFNNLDHIYYINVDSRTDKRDFMESWLKPFSIQYSIPYQRISAMTSDDSCNLILNNEIAKQRCLGVKGLRNSNLYIMDNCNTTGYTLVVEDDYQILNYTRLVNGVKKVPQDWDVLRFDCWTGPDGINPIHEFPQYDFGYRTVTPSKKWYCGGTHATLWRSDRLHILRKIWEHPKKPKAGIDCLLADDNVRSYCVQADIGHLFKNEFKSDIPKLRKKKEIG